MYPNQPYLQSVDSPGLIDSHCHLDLEPLYTGLAELLLRARKAGVNGFVVPGVHPQGWQCMQALPLLDAAIMPSFGIHPMHAAAATDQALQQLAGLAPQGVAIGEIGLDPGYDVPLEQQELAFRRQLRLAVELRLPVLIHCRRLFQRTLQVLQQEGAERCGGIMHAFSGSVEMAREFIRLGFVISLCGTVTWQNAVRPLRLARELPLDQLVLETDAPDLTPQRYRGHPNQPAWITETADRVAEVRGITTAVLAAATTATVRRVLHLPTD